MFPGIKKRGNSKTVYQLKDLSVGSHFAGSAFRLFIVFWFELYFRRYVEFQ